MTYHDELTAAFREMHGCLAEFLYAIPVRDVFRGHHVWDGAVWLFKLTGHAKANFGYAWLHANAAGDDLQVTLVVEMPSVTSAQRAARTAFEDVRGEYGRK